MHLWFHFPNYIREVKKACLPLKPTLSLSSLSMKQIYYFKVDSSTAYSIHQKEKSILSFEFVILRLHSNLTAQSIWRKMLTLKTYVAAGLVPPGSGYGRAKWHLITRKKKKLPRTSISSEQYTLINCHTVDKIISRVYAHSQFCL